MTAYSVTIYEFERGWGSRVDEIRYFDSPSKAKAFVASFNANNNEPQVPDWYMVADYTGTVEVS